MQTNYDITDRFELLIFEDAEEYIERKKKELEEKNRLEAIERKKLEEEGVCEGCDSQDFLRWVHNKEVYLCCDCFMHDLQCQADVQVPMHRAEDMNGYDEYLNWDNLWEEENEGKIL